VSNVRYPKFPGIGFKSAKGIAGTVFNIALLIGGLTIPEYVLFPLGMTYMAYGLVRALVLGLLERDQDEEIEDDHDEPVAETVTDFPDMRRIRDRRKDAMP
jgi:hypothetical protein